MPIPDYQTLMRPVLVTLDTQGDMSLRNLVDLLSAHPEPYQTGFVLGWHGRATFDGKIPAEGKLPGCIESLLNHAGKDVDEDGYEHGWAAASA